MIAIARHIIESSLFAALMRLLAGALRRQSASTRHVLLLGAAFKFALPIALLVSFGTSVRHIVPISVSVGSAPKIVSAVLRWPAASTAQISDGLIVDVAFCIWTAGFMLALFRWVRGTREPLDFAGEVSSEAQFSLERMRRQLGLARAPRLRISRSKLEPRLIGYWRPVIVLPEMLHELSPGALDAVLLHELAHAQRRDNLTRFGVHALTCVFWFHPLLAWLEQRIAAESELACDELVLRNGIAPQDYLDGILHVCKACVLAPVPGASGFSGSNLRERMEFIMSFDASPLRSRLVDILGGLCLPILSAAAILAGVVTVPYSRAQSGVAADGQRPSVACLFAGVSYPEGVVIKQGAGPQQMCADLDGRPHWIRTSNESREQSKQMISLPEPAPFVCKPAASSGKFCTCADNVLFSVGSRAWSTQGAVLSCAAGPKWEVVKKP